MVHEKCAATRFLIASPVVSTPNIAKISPAQWTFYDEKVSSGRGNGWSLRDFISPFNFFNHVISFIDSSHFIY